MSRRRGNEDVEAEVAAAFGPFVGLIREYLPKGTHITDHQPYLTAIAEELNERPRAILGYLTPREAFENLLVASTP